MISLQSKKSVKTPNLNQITDPVLQQILNDFAKVITDNARNVYQDLSALNIDVFYFGDPNTNGSWRIIPVGNNLSVQRREGGIWVDKHSFTP